MNNLRNLKSQESQENNARVTEIGYQLEDEDATAASHDGVRQHQQGNASPTVWSNKEEKALSGRWLIETLLLVGLAFVIALGIRHFLVEPYRVPSGSMLPTIQLQDQILANKFVYLVGGKPQQKDIIVFLDPTGEYDNLIKRVIAVGGQTIDLSPDGEVIIDGVVIDEPYVHGKPTDVLYPDLGVLSGPIEYPFSIPEGYVWVMGDNRTHSADSRVFGPVPLSVVKGRAFFTYWPLTNFAPLR